MNGSKPNSRELLRRIAELSSETEWTSDETRAALTEAGIRPEEIADSIVQLVTRYKKDSPFHLSSDQEWRKHSDMNCVDCQSKVIAALNQIFGVGFALNQIVRDDSGLHGGAYNVSVDADDLPLSTFNKVAPGRYPLNKLLGYVLGLGEHLHIPAHGERINGDTATFFKWLPARSVTLDAHIDHGFPYHPIGLLVHFFVDIALAKFRAPC